MILGFETLLVFNSQRMSCETLTSAPPIPKTTIPDYKPGIIILSPSFINRESTPYANPYSSIFLYTVVNPMFSSLAASTLLPFV
jgi:hypothetical protein